MVGLRAEWLASSTVASKAWIKVDLKVVPTVAMKAACSVASKVAKKAAVKVC